MPHADITNDLAFHLYAEWEAEQARGNATTLEEACAAYPELLPQVREIARALAALAPLFPPGPGGEPATPPGSAEADARYPEDWSEIGRGASSIVYRGEDATFGTAVAFKVLHPQDQLLSPPDVVRLMWRFEQEARILARLKHDGIVRIFKTFSLGGRPVLEMEYLPGGSLVTHLETVRGRGAAGIARFVERVARAVGFAHEHGIVHRDLKPSNILLDAAGRPCVSDFGVAKLLAPDTDERRRVDPAADTDLESAALTVLGRQPGTKAYMAPEQFDPSFGPISPATDVWALGVILYELLTGQRPFLGDAVQLREAVTRAEPTRPSRRGARLSRRLEQVVLRCLRKQPSERYPTAAALADALDSCRPTPLRLGRWLAVTAVAAAPIVAVALGARLPGWEDWVYRRATADATATVAGGGEAKLVGPDRRPPHRWQTGRGKVDWQPTDAGGGELTVTTLEPSLLELLPDPGRDEYEVSISLRQEAYYTEFASVAAYIGHTAFQTDEGPQHGLVGVAFADLGPRALCARDGHGQPCSHLELGLMIYGETRADPFRTLFTTHQSCQVRYRAPDPDSPPGPWRQLTVAVRGGRVSATGHWVGGEGVALDAAQRWASFVPEKARDGHPDLAAAPDLWRPRGGLGLYIYGCKVTVSGLVVRPLTP